MALKYAIVRGATDVEATAQLSASLMRTTLSAALSPAPVMVTSVPVVPASTCVGTNDVATPRSRNSCEPPTWTKKPPTPPNAMHTLYTPALRPVGCSANETIVGNVLSDCLNTALAEPAMTAATPHDC